MERWIISHKVCGKKRLALFILAKSKGISVWPLTESGDDMEHFPLLGWDGIDIGSFTTNVRPVQFDSHFVTYEEAIQKILAYDNKKSEDAAHDR